LRKTPYIVSLRGSDVPYYDIYNKKVHFLNILLKPLNRHIWRKAKRVVALSQSLRNTALRTSPNQEIQVIPNGVEPELFTPPKSERKPNKEFRMITVSRLVKRKGIHHILQTLAQIKDKDIRLLIVGTGNYESSLKNLCSKLKLNALVTFYGYCPRERLCELYNRSDVFILPSLVESFGLVFAEAMACGLPIIGARTGGILDLVKNENGILVEPGDIDGLDVAVRKLMHDVELRKSMGRKSREIIMAHHNWERVTAQYLEAYRELVRSR
jgi:glycosyltransferase involved in cell wall biosynthesis